MFSNTLSVVLYKKIVTLTILSEIEVEVTLANISVTNSYSPTVVVGLTKLTLGISENL